MVLLSLYRLLKNVAILFVCLNNFSLSLCWYSLFILPKSSHRDSTEGGTFSRCRFGHFSLLRFFFRRSGFSFSFLPRCRIGCICKHSFSSLCSRMVYSIWSGGEVR